METIDKSVSSSNNRAAAAGGAMDQATGSAHKMVDQVSEAVRPAVDRIAAGAHQTVDKFADAATRAVDTFDTKSGQLKEMQPRVSESCRVHVRDKPLRSVGYAVAAGFLLSWLIKGR